MKKRLLSLLLVLILSLSLSAPALADGWDLTTPEWSAWKTEWVAAHPEEVAAFDPYAYFELDSSFSHFSWYESPEEYMESWGLETEEAFCDHVLDIWLTEMRTNEENQAWMDQYEAENPGAISQFDADAWFMEHYYEDPKLEYMERWGLETPGEFSDFMLEDFIAVCMEEERWQATLAEYEAQNPGAIAQFDADAWFELEYSWWSGGKEGYMTMMGYESEEAFQEAMLSDMVYSASFVDDTQDYYDQVILELGGVPGQLNIMLDGTYLAFGEQVPYAEQGVTYAPAAVLSEALGTQLEAGKDGYVALRTAAETAGYEVLWDSPYQTAVLVDRAGFIAETDTRFTVINGALGSFAADSDQNYASAMDVVVEWTQFNSLDGNKTYSMTADADTLTGPAGEEMSGTYDVSAIKDILEAAIPYYTELYEDEFAEFMPLLKGDFDVLLDREGEMLYLRVNPLFTYLFSMAGKEYPKDMWVSQPVGDILTAAADMTPTVGNYLCLLVDTDQWISPIYRYQNLSQGADTLAGLLGDDCFELQGKDHVLTMDKQELCLLLDPEDPEYYASEIGAFDLKLIIKADGAITGDLLFRTAPSYLMGLGDVQFTADWSCSFAKGKVEMEFHIKNQGALRLSITTANKESSSAPTVTPPEGAVVIPADDLQG